jgi:hypothetical protein
MADVYVPHPYLFDGVNSVALGEDEDNGAGVNWELDPLLFDAEEVFSPIIVPQDIRFPEVDMCIGREYRNMIVPPENQTICVRGEV